MTRPAVSAVKRKPLTRREFGFLILRQDMLCGCGCGARLDFSEPGMVIDEHLLPLVQGGTNELSNRALWNRKCSLAKTASEAPVNAKGRRLRGETGQTKRRAERKADGTQDRMWRKPPVSPLSKKHPNYRKGTWK